MSQSTTSRSRKIRLVCISDTHGHGPGQGFTLPSGDILIHAGDLTNQGSLSEVKKSARWLEEANFAVKIIVAGNHDLSLDRDYRLRHAEGWRVLPTNGEECRQIMRSIPGVIYLDHENVDVIVDNIPLRVFGSPCSLDRGTQNWAFQYEEERGHDLWSAVPEDTDILVTHTPAQGYVDASKHWPLGGCPALAKTLGHVQPKVHVCGHHHEGRGAVIVHWKEQGGKTEIVPWPDPGKGNKKQSLLSLLETSHGVTAIVNASIMKNSWTASRQKEFNKPIVVDIRPALTPSKQVAALAGQQ